MLISFSVKNYRSFADEQTFSMVAGTSSKKHAKFSFKTPNSQADHLLKSVAIFGANGSGKTSLISALHLMKDFVVNSAQRTQEGDKIDASPHLLRAGLESKPSEFEITFIHGDNYYQYGFALDQDIIHEEWLFSRPNAEKARTRMLFRRQYEPSTGSYIWDINERFIRGEREVWKQSTRSNALFLSQAVQLNAHDLKEPFYWIQNKLRIVKSPERLSHDFTARLCLEKNWKSKILDLLQSVGIKIQGLDVELKDFDISVLPDDIPSSLIEEFKKIKTFSVQSYHKNDKGDLVSMDFGEESEGTKVLFSLAGPWFDVLEDGDTLFVDELHNSLHPHAMKVLIGLFHDPKLNKHNAQLIFTSHETSVMAKGFMHQDQLWFTEKNDTESTDLVPLSNYHVREFANFQKAYLDGRYGGVPQLKEFFNVG